MDVATSKGIDTLCVNTIRALSMDAVQKANSGHPGTPMGMAGIGYILWTRYLKHNPRNPQWPNRDRFVLSMGHASMLLYSLLHLTGYDLTLDDIKDFRQWQSRTAGHPEFGLAPGVETTTGPLGQGFANGVGMAIAEQFLAAQFNRPGHSIVDHYTYAFCSDGDLMEGISYEAASLAGHLKLGKLIYFYDDNKISIDGSTEITFSENVRQRFEALGWHVQEIDGMDLKQIGTAIEVAKVTSDRPSLIISPTHIGYPSPNKQDTSAAHGAPLGEDEVRLTKEVMDWPDEPFHVPEEALEEFRQCVGRGEAAQAEWQERFDQYRGEFPEEAQRFEAQMAGNLPKGWDEAIPEFKPDDGPLATRKAGRKVLNAFARKIPNLIGGSADLVSSTNTVVEDSGSFNADDRSGRNFHFGIREHAMGSITNGMAAHGGVIPFGSTFFVFSDYQRPAIRLAALSGFHNIFVFTHDSVGLGEDGPTHQPIEHLASLRAMPDLVVIRPADANETSYAWKVALDRTGPSAIVLTRQGLPILGRNQYALADGLTHGAYILSEAEGGDPKAIIIATGSEVRVALEAQKQLQESGTPTRVVSMPSWELFAEQPQSYRDEVLPPSVSARVSVEAGATLGWERWIGREGIAIGIDRFGASAPGKVVLEKLGISTDSVVRRVKMLLL
jgi:transketolase